MSFEFPTSQVPKAAEPGVVANGLESVFKNSKLRIKN
jgi:hypothetical protein